MKRIATMTAGLALSISSLAVAGTAHADDPTDPTTEPCATQTAKVEKAEAALARVTAVFERQAAKVKEAKGELRAAEKANEKAIEKKQLAEAKAKKDEAKKAKKAQLQRLAKAQERLATCEAEAAETEPAPVQG